MKDSSIRFSHLLSKGWIIISILAFPGCVGSSVARNLPPKGEVISAMETANEYFMLKWPDVGKTIVTDRERVSNIWTRAVYYEGLMALHKLNPKPEYYNYAVRWAEHHEWNLRRGDTFTRNADNQCAGQTYIDLYLIEPEPERIRYIKMSIDSMMNTDKIDDWNWIDALQMAMPVFARLGNYYKDDAYFDRMYEMYKSTKDSIGGGLYNYEDQLWWRDASFKPPYLEPNGEDCYWSRGNGWVFAALARVLDLLPDDSQYRAEVQQNFVEMAEALVKVQRKDGFWNVSLHDPENFGGKETTGTSLFTYGMAWGIDQGFLNKDQYLPIVTKAWNGLVNEALHENGFLGYVQGTGSGPADGQPVAHDHEPNFEDYGLGCFLLAGSEVFKLAE